MHSYKYQVSGGKYQVIINGPEYIVTVDKRLVAPVIIIISMDKRSLHHSLRYIRRIHPWYFLVLAMIAGAIGIIALRQNNERMIVLRDAVYQADKDNGDVEGALHNLREYVFGHMNTSLASGPNAVHPPIQLKYTYERLQAAQQEGLGQNNSKLYGQAQQACEAQGETTTAQSTISCIQEYAASHGIQLAAIPEGLYKFDFVSAKWSPDLAGWSLVVAIASAIGFVVSLAYRWFMKKYL